MLILSVDPGYERIGIAIIKRSPKKDTLLYSNCFKTKSSLVFYERLKMLGTEIERLIKEFKPSILAIETLFFVKNQKTAMGVSEARGVIIYQAVRENLKVYEYTPLQIKMATTGYGKSDKKQVIEMVKRLIKINQQKPQDDEFDAIAVGLTYLAINNPSL